MVDIIQRQFPTIDKGSGEFGYSSHRYYLTEDGLDKDGIIKSGEFSYVLGLDYQGFSDTFISAQFFQTLITSYKKDIIQDELEYSSTFLIEKKFLNDTLSAEALLIHNFNDGDGSLQAGLSYQLSSSVFIKLGIDIFYGSKKGLFGQFNDRDRLSFGIEAGF